MHEPYKALYIHIPFCKSRCVYCDFTSTACKSEDAKIDEYIESLCLDIRKWAHKAELSEIKTVYIGGGTPSFVGMKRLSMLIHALSVFCNITNSVEFTIEANPESLSERMVYDLYALGVNRISIGVQSFDDDVLKLLGRAHTAQGALDAIGAAKTRFENVSVDLMCGIPGQSEQQFKQSLAQAIEAGVSHISIYPLTIEQHTTLANMVLAGQVADVDADVQARHMELAAEVLEAYGFKRYEVASYARTGFECEHNIAYWTGVPYLGIGTSAASMTQDDNRRMRIQDGHVTDDLNKQQMVAEDLMLAMRMSRGVKHAQVQKAEKHIAGVGRTFESLQEKGLVVRTENAWVPTKQGWLCGNELYGAIYDLA